MDMHIQTESTQGTWKGLAVGIGTAIWWVLTAIAGGALWLLQKVTSTLDAHNTMGSLVDAAGEALQHLPDADQSDEDMGDSGQVFDEEIDYDDEPQASFPYRTHHSAYDTSVPSFINEEYR